MEVLVRASLEDVAPSCSYAVVNAEEVLARVSRASVVRSCLIQEIESSGDRLTGSGVV